MIFVVLYKYLNSAADKTVDGSHSARTDCNYRIILLMLFITLWGVIRK